MVNRMRQLGMEDTKPMCGCTNRGVFIDRHGTGRRIRIHKETCHYRKHPKNGKSNMPFKQVMV